MGEDTVDHAALVAGLDERPSRTADLRLHGWAEAGPLQRVDRLRRGRPGPRPPRRRAPRLGRAPPPPPPLPRLRGRLGRPPRDGPHGRGRPRPPHPLPAPRRPGQRGDGAGGGGLLAAELGRDEAWHGGRWRSTGRWRGGTGWTHPSCDRGTRPAPPPAARAGAPAGAPPCGPRRSGCAAAPRCRRRCRARSRSRKRGSSLSPRRHQRTASKPQAARASASISRFQRNWWRHPRKARLIASAASRFSAASPSSR